MDEAVAAASGGEARDVSVELLVFLVLLAVALYKLHNRWTQDNEHSGDADESNKESVHKHLSQLLHNKSIHKVHVWEPISSFPAISSPLHHIREVRIPIAVSDIDLSPLKKCIRLETLYLAGPPLSKAHLNTLQSLSSLHTLQLKQSRVVVDKNNSVKGFCKVEDVLHLARTHTSLQRLFLPPHVCKPIGVVAKVFGKANVAVVKLKHSIAVGDIVFLQRTQTSFESGSNSAHHWKSKQTIVEEIRLDNHDTVSIAEYNDTLGDDHIDNKVAIKLNEVGKVGDAVMWCGMEKPQQQ
eukprot:m.46447 g.46447  ORF g.46447 m.46447 type:complete len:296 (-) comp10719_c0_seq16:2489-3376(-)